MLSPRWIKDAYRGTEVNYWRTQSQIHKLLGDLGIYQIRFTNFTDKFCLEFLTEVEEKQKPRAVRILIPLKSSHSDERKRTSELNTIHRILYAHLRSKFISIGSGLTEFENEFMSNLVITDPTGASKTMGEAVLPQYRKNIESGENKDFKLLT